MAQNFSKIVEVDQIPAITVSTLPPITGSVAVTNLPAVQPVNDNSGSLTVDGTIAVSSIPAITGSVSVSNFPVTQPISGTVTVANPGLTDAQLRATAVPVTIPTPVPVTDNAGSLTVDGTVAVSSLPSTTVGTATVTRVTTNPTSAVTLLASNVNRVMAIFHNETGTLFLKFGSTASDTDYTYRLIGNTVLEVTRYYGIVTARKGSGTSEVQVTEL